MIWSYIACPAGGSVHFPAFWIAFKTLEPSSNGAVTAVERAASHHWLHYEVTRHCLLPKARFRGARNLDGSEHTRIRTRRTNQRDASGPAAASLFSIPVSSASLLFCPGWAHMHVGS